MSTSPATDKAANKFLDTTTVSLSKKKQKQWPKEIFDSVYGKITLDTTSSMVVPMAGQCGVKFQNGTVLYRYEPKNNKGLGIWPRSARYNSLSRLSELKNKFGFSYLFFDAGIDNDVWTNIASSGFTLNKYMIALTGIPDQNRSGYITHYGNAYAYYVGEPADQNHSMGGIRNVLNQNNYSSLFVIDGYKRTDALNAAVGQADKVLFSAYCHWYEIAPGVWSDYWCYNPDQRADWSDMRSRYGQKFTMTWVGAHRDLSDYDDLLGHAQNLNLDKVWLYAADDATDD